MHLTSEEVLNYLGVHQISYQLYQHEPVFTCEQAIKIVHEMKIDGAGIKNLFLKDNKKKFYHIVALDTARVDLKSVGKVLQTPGLRFADADLLMHYLGVYPGSVTPLALINDKDHAVQAILDVNIFKQEYIQIHPLKNNATIVITPADLIKFFSLTNRSYLVYDFYLNQLLT